MPDISKPHDGFFRETFSRPDICGDFLINYLPPEVVRHLEMPSLELVKDTFVDIDLRDHFSDMLCRVRLLAGGEAYVYALLEHKSWPDMLTAFQVLRYMARIWDQDYRNYEAAEKKRRKSGKKKKTEPFRPNLIIPVVIYHGERKWSVSKKFAALFDCAPELAFCIPDFRYILCDLSSYKDEEVRGAVMLRTALLIMKYIFSDDLADKLPDIFSLFRELMTQTTGAEYLKTVLTYITGSTEKVSREELDRALASALKSQGGVLMATIAEKWIEEGREEGREEGKEEGKKEILLEVIKVGIESKFGEDGLKCLSEIQAVDDINLLSAIQRKLWMADCLDDIRKMYIDK